MNVWQKSSGLVGELSKMKGIINNVSSDLAWVAGVSMQRSEADEEKAKDYLKVRSARYWCDQEMDWCRAPHNGTHADSRRGQDDLFYANEGLRIFSTCMAAPSRMIITNHGHIVGDGRRLHGVPGWSRVREWINGEVERWFDRYLKGGTTGGGEGSRLVYKPLGHP